MGKASRLNRARRAVDDEQSLASIKPANLTFALWSTASGQHVGDGRDMAAAALMAALRLERHDPEYVYWTAKFTAHELSGVGPFLGALQRLVAAGELYESMPRPT